MKNNPKLLKSENKEELVAVILEQKMLVEVLDVLDKALRSKRDYLVQLVNSPVALTPVQALDEDVLEYEIEQLEAAQIQLEAVFNEDN